MTTDGDPPPPPPEPPTGAAPLLLLLDDEELDELDEELLEDPEDVVPPEVEIELEEAGVLICTTISLLTVNPDELKTITL